MTNSDNFQFVNSEFSHAVAETIGKQYPTLKILSRSRQEIVYDGSTLSEQDNADLLLDLRFYDSNPFIPLENICSKMANYVARNESQAELLKYADMLLNFESQLGAGLYMFGDAGIGKTHMAVALAKQFMIRGFEPNFQSAERFTFSTKLNLGDDQVWIIDDLNSGYGIASRLFREVVLNVHERGGRVFITSNKPYDLMLKELFVGDGPANKMRYEDRTKGMMKVLNVTGDSRRQINAWYNI